VKSKSSLSSYRKKKQVFTLNTSIHSVDDSEHTRIVDDIGEDFSGVDDPISSATSPVYLLWVDLSDPLVLCLWANYFAVLDYARVFSRCNDFVPLHSEGIYRALCCHAFLQSSTCPEHQSSLNSWSVFPSRESYVARETYWVLLQFIWGGQAQRIYAQDSGSHS